MVKIAPSLLSADFGKLREEIEDVHRARDLRSVAVVERREIARQLHDFLREPGGLVTREPEPLHDRAGRRSQLLSLLARQSSRLPEVVREFLHRARRPTEHRLELRGRLLSGSAKVEDILGELHGDRDTQHRERGL